VKTETGDENYERQQRRQSDESIPDEARVVDLFSIQKFRKQVPAQAHKERDAAVPFIDYRGGKKTRCVLKGDCLGVDEMPLENQQGGERP
jgi:hypothetical protein